MHAAGFGVLLLVLGGSLMLGSALFLVFKLFER